MPTSLMDVKHILIRAMALLTITGAAISPAPQALAQAAVDRATLTARVQKIADDYLAAHKEGEGITAVSVSVSLAGGQEPSINAVAGRVSKDPDAAPVTPESLFDIGSITKSMTAVVVLQLVREGVLSLDEPIGRWLPEYPAWREVTLRRLLTMTSGIPSYDRTTAFLNSFAKWGIGRHFSKEQLVSFVDPELPDAPPPTKGFDYSNTNYIIAEMIIERATGQSFADHLTRRILHGRTGPRRHILRSVNLPLNSVMSRLVSGYAIRFEPAFKPVEPFIGMDLKFQDLSWAQAAGGAVATPEDVTRWARLLFQGPVLSDAERGELTKLVSMKTGEPVSEPSADDPMAFGLGVSGAHLGAGRNVWVYEGETMGNRSVYILFPERTWSWPWRSTRPPERKTVSAKPPRRSTRPSPATTSTWTRCNLLD